MRNLAFAACLALVACGQPTQSRADVIEDPLHFFCTGCGTDNGSFTPDPTGVFSGVTITSSPPGAIGDLTLKLLIPNTFSVNGSFSDAVTVSGQGTGGNLTLFSLSQFVAGMDLDTDFLGRTRAPGAPQNPFGAFAINVDSSLTGFFVATLDVGPINLSNAFSLNVAALGSGCAGCWLLGDLATAQGDISTAPSSALLVNTTVAVPGPVAGAGIPGLVAALLGLLGLGRRRRRRNLGVA